MIHQAAGLLNMACVRRTVCVSVCGENILRICWKKKQKQQQSSPGDEVLNFKFWILNFEFPVLQHDGDLPMAVSMTGRCSVQSSSSDPHRLRARLLVRQSR